MRDDDFEKSINACAAHYGDDADDVRAYMIAGLEKARVAANRGAVRFTDDGQLHPDIVDAYDQYGFYIFEGAVSDAELVDIQSDVAAMRECFPVAPDAKVDAQGRPAIGVDCQGMGLIWSKPLSDPMGGTAIANGRHQVKLKDLKPADDAPAAAPFILLGSLQFSEAALRIYGHPTFLRVAAAVNGDDFAPFNEVIFIKDPGLGAAVAWHQDGDTHWDNPAFDAGIHGFNFMAQVYGSTPVNGVWVVPGTHKMGKIDIKELVKASGSERLTGAMPIVCDAGDVVMCNRQLVHGSFANAGFEPRMTLNFGFHRRSSVLGVKGAGIHSPVAVYDEDIINQRSRAIGYAIAARCHQYPDEVPFAYVPHKGETFVWNDAAKKDLKDYNLLDLSI